jgi:2-polyprenyl-3-methyl-5-hydroxy-6-metoxy-1,4-benzoquinol methylase
MMRCNICGETSSQVEEGAVRSNCRKFGDTQFRIWRCPKCRSVHATDEVDLAECYRDYPYHQIGMQEKGRWVINSGYRNLLGRLRKAGLKRDHKILDYGCGGGAFLSFLRKKGYDAAGYDEYSEGFNDRSVLETKYDLVLSQDVIEHVLEPWEHVHTLSGLVAPGGVVVIGTPNAEAFDLRNPEPSVHALHQPYHRHILSKRALLSIGDRVNWQLLRFYSKTHTATLMPFVNGHFLRHYCCTGDDTLDYILEPIRFGNPKLYKPSAAFWALFGYFFEATDAVMAIYRASP